MTLALELEDPIEEAFPIMVDASRKLCPSRSGTDLCYKYHRLWPYTRLIAGMRGHESRKRMAAEYFAACAADGAHRVLISGTADYAILARVIYGFRNCGVEPQITVLDICEAPLLINQWYAERHSANIQTVATDVLAYAPEKSFDVVTTDIFISRIDRQRWPDLLSVWHRALVPGGRALTVERVAADGVSTEHVHNEDETEAKVKKVVGRAAPLLEVMDIDQETLATYVREYHGAQVMNLFSSTNELRATFEANGFAIEKLEHQPRREDSVTKAYETYAIAARSVPLVSGAT